MKIWKQAIRKGQATYSLPVDAEIIHFDVDPGSATPGDPWTGMAFWFKTHGNPNTDFVAWQFDVVPTGLDFPDDAAHFGSVVLLPYAWHLIGRHEPRGI